MIISSVIGSIGIVITCLALKLIISSQIVIIIASVILSVVVYACILKLCHNPIYDYVMNSLKAKILK